MFAEWLNEKSEAENQASSLLWCLLGFSDREEKLLPWCDGYLDYQFDWIKKCLGELGCSSVVECLPGMHEALGLIPNTKKRKDQTNKQQTKCLGDK
jgi:hypothetical protein